MAVVDVLLKQYEMLRAEITQCIYLEHLAILAIFTFLGAAISVILTGEMLPWWQTPAGNCLRTGVGLREYMPWVLIIAVFVVNALGSLFMKEQVRNRRACIMQRYIETLLNSRIETIGICWENFLISEALNVSSKSLGMKRAFLTLLPINRQYYWHRLLGVGMPILVTNIGALAALALFNAGKLPTLNSLSFSLNTFLTSACFVMFILWAIPIARGTFKPIKTETTKKLEMSMKNWLEKNSALFGEFADLPDWQQRDMT